MMQIVYDNNKNQAYVSMQEHIAHMKLLKRIWTSSSQTRFRPKSKGSLISSTTNVSPRATIEMKSDFLMRQK